MKIFTILLSLLFIVGIASAETYTMALCGNSFGLPDPDTVSAAPIYQDGDTIIVTEVSPPISTSYLDEYFPGAHNEIGVNFAQSATPADFYTSCIGCPELHDRRFFDILIRGKLTGGSRSESVRELRNLPLKRNKSPYQDLYEPPVQPRVQPFWRGDVVHLWIWGTGGKATVNGIEWPCFFLANAEGNCLDIGGDPLFPWELRAIIESVIGGAKFYIYLNFAYAGAWEFWLESPNIYVWSGVGASELCYLIEDGDLACYMWDGYDIDECYFVEPLGYQAMCLKMRDTDNDYNPYAWDGNGDYWVMMSEASAALTERCQTSSSSYTGGDRRLYFYADEEPRDGDNIVVEIMPNPFNPVAWIGFELPQDMRVKIIVFNILGQKVATVVDDHLQAGAHRFSFNGSSLTSGIYFVRGELGKASVTKKMSLVK